MDPSPTNRSFCTMCRQTRSISEFPLNRNGAPYKTCRLCKERSASNRRALGEIDPNARSLRNRTVPDRPQNPRPQKRRRVDNVQSNATLAAGITGAEGRAEQHVMEGDMSVGLANPTTLIYTLLLTFCFTDTTTPPTRGSASLEDLMEPFNMNQAISGP